MATVFVFVASALAGPPPPGAGLPSPSPSPPQPLPSPSPATRVLSSLPFLCDESAFSSVSWTTGCQECGVVIENDHVAKAATNAFRRRSEPPAAYNTCSDYCADQSLSCAAAHYVTAESGDCSIGNTIYYTQTQYCTTPMETLYDDLLQVVCTCTPAGYASADLCDESSWSDVSEVCGDCSQSGTYARG